MEVFDSPQEIFSATISELEERAGVSELLAKAIKDPSIQDKAEAELRQVRQAGITVITLKDSSYPKSLSAIPDPPPILYLKGLLLPEDHQALAIVGSRRATPYGVRIAERMGHDLSIHGFTIISGLARGIDSAAHTGALTAGGRTLAVLGCGLDIVYPPENVRLREEIIEQGAVLTEFPLGTPPLPGNFPHRNRVISGLSLGTLVVEATQHSGSLITAQQALDQGREVFAIPGSLDAVNSHGTNRLIKAGAKLVQDIQDILEELAPQLEGRPRIPLKNKASSRADTLGPVEATLYGLLSEEPRHIDELIIQSRLPSAQVSGVLLELELRGTVKQLSGHLYVRN